MVLVARNLEKAKSVAHKIINESSNQNIHWLYADLGNQASIRNLAGEFKKKFHKLDLLSNNAGIIQPKREETSDGVEKTLAVDYLSHFLLSNLLTDILKENAPSRIITVVGGRRELRLAKIHMDDIQLKTNYNMLKATLQAGLLRMLFTKEMARRVWHMGITCNAFHPGFVKSGLASNLTGLLKIAGNAIQPFLGNESKTSIYLATAKEVEQVTGKLFIKNKPFDFPYDSATIEKIWEISEKLTSLV